MPARFAAPILLFVLLFGGCGTEAIKRDRAARVGTPAVSPTATAAATRPAAPARSSAWRHVVWIVMENKAYDSAVGASQAPYTSRLATRFGIATNYRAVTHPSLPNYIALTSGSTHGVEDDAEPAEHELEGPSLFSQVGDWRALQEGMPSNCRLTSDGRYAVKHNPAAYYVGLRDACGRRDVPLGSPPDLSARFTFVTPDMCNDTHDCPVATGDRWLASFVPQVLDSPEYRSGSTVVFLTWDEDDGSADNRIPAIVISPRTRGVESGEGFTHYSLLRTTEELLGLPPLGSAASAPSMRQAFGL